MSTNKALSKLERVPLREAWKHEANEFTPWLAETDNLERAGGRIGFERTCARSHRALGW